MGTGIPATLILSSPYPVVAEKLRIPAVIFLLLDTFLFALFFVAMTLRYILFPKIWKATWKHETHSLYIGTFPASASSLVGDEVIRLSRAHPILLPSFAFVDEHVDSHLRSCISLSGVWDG
jgi:tellurite resistance protein TehA-like permease